MTQRRILVTSALPYANGPIHLGHLVEYIQTDIWVRFQRLAGRRVVYICADDTHGTAIMIRARQEGRSEEALIADMQSEHERDFKAFDVAFDHYGSTHSPENRELCAEIWQGLRKAGLIFEREVTQLYDPVQGTFLADRFVRGTCPRCKSPNQYGDSCDKCGSTYSPTELIDPVSAHSGATPEIRAAQHLFVNTEQRHAFLEEWTQTGDRLQADVSRWLAAAFLSEPLRDWDISRPAPYFGFEISDAPGHYWYVWFDAPIGYLAATKAWCKKTGENFDDWWRDAGRRAAGAEMPPTEIHHFIGKDITYFHTLFWPVMLQAAGFDLPRMIHIHGFLTVNGEKMSKTKGTFVRAATYLEHMDPAWLRYFYASKLTPKLDDLDLNLEEFIAKVNGDLVGKLVNLASRTAGFVRQTGLSSRYPEDGGLFAAAATEGEAIAAAYEACDYNRAMRLAMALADRANKFVEERAPWKLRKDPEQAALLQDTCSVALNLFRQLAVYLAPVLPRLAEQTGQLLHSPIANWKQAANPLVGSQVGQFVPMMTRVDLRQIEAMLNVSKQETPVEPDQPATGSAAAAGAAAASQSSSGSSSSGSSSSGSSSSNSAGSDGPEALTAEPLAAEIAYDDFAKVDLRIARVIAADEVPKSKKLLRLTVSLGGDVQRNIFAGIKSAYRPEQLVGRLVVIAANLQPRQMTFGLSEGMVVAAGAGGDQIFIIGPDAGAKPGQRLH